MKADFLLTTPLAKELYAKIADLPLIDYHNHLAVSDLADDRKFLDITELWLLNDPYKHRALRILGVDEHMITGKASNYEKFAVWAKNLPRLVGNPLYHWSQLELFKVFGIEESLSADNALSVWTRCCSLLSDNYFSARSLLRRFKVEINCPCAGLTDDLSTFKALCAEDGFKTVPSMRGDDILDADKDFMERLSESSGDEIVSLDSLRTSLGKRLREFSGLGCCFADHSLDAGFKYFPDDGRNHIRLNLILNGETLCDNDRSAFRSKLLRLLGEEYAKLGWTVQLHIGAQRVTSSRLRDIAGPAGGYACIGQACNVSDIATLLNSWEQNAVGMPNVILFSMNPTDNAVMATLSGSFVESGKCGKLQFGPAWWLNDHIHGMRAHFESLAAYGVISSFIGMTTDSRSLLSFVRHEYFRRVLCAWIAEKVNSNEFPEDKELLTDIAISVSYLNAAKYFRSNIVGK